MIQQNTPRSGWSKVVLILSARFFSHPRLLEPFFEAFLFSVSEQRSSAADAGTHSSAYNTIAIQFAPKHLGLILVR